MRIHRYTIGCVVAITVVAGCSDGEGTDQVTGGDAVEDSADSGEEPTSSGGTNGADDLRLPTGPDDGQQGRFCEVSWGWQSAPSKFGADGTPQWQIDLEIQQEELAELEAARVTLLDSAPTFLRDGVTAQLDRDEDLIQARIALAEEENVGSTDPRWSDPLGLSPEAAAAAFGESSRVELATLVYCGDLTEEQVRDAVTFEGADAPPVELDGASSSEPLGALAEDIATTLVEDGPAAVYEQLGLDECRRLVADPAARVRSNLSFEGEGPPAELRAAVSSTDDDESITIELGDGDGGSQSLSFQIVSDGDGLAIAC